MADRVPPSNVEAEMALLGALFLGGSDLVEQIAEDMDASMFYREAHALVWNAMVDLATRRDPVDWITVKGALDRAKALDAAGGIGYLMQLGEFVPTAANAAYHAKLVREAAHLRRLIEAASTIAGECYAPDADAAEVGDRSQERIAAACALGKQSRRSVLTLGRMLADTVALLADNQGRPPLRGVPTGLAEYDAMTLGLEKAEMTLFGARPGVGKTALACTVTIAAARANCRTLVFSLEMSARPPEADELPDVPFDESVDLEASAASAAADAGEERAAIPPPQLAVRLLAALSKIDGMKIRAGVLTDDELRRLNAAYEWLFDSPVEIDDTPGLTALDIRARTRAFARRRGRVDLVIVDYLQLVRSEAVRAGREENRNQEVGAVAYALREMAREHNCAVMALVQLSRSVERRQDKRPMLSDLRDSGELEQHAGNVVFLYRDSLYASKTDDFGRELPEVPSTTPDEVELIVAKQRMGRMGTVKALYTPAYCVFNNAAPEWRQDAPGAYGGGGYGGVL